MNLYNVLPKFMKSGLSIFGIKDLTGLQIINVKPRIIKTNEKSFNIIIDGVITNLSGNDKTLPPLTIYIEDNNGKKYEYVANLNKKSLKSIEYYKFNYKIFALEFEPRKIDISMVNGINKYIRYKN